MQAGWNPAFLGKPMLAPSNHPLFHFMLWILKTGTSSDGNHTGLSKIFCHVQGSANSWMFKWCWRGPSGVQCVLLSFFRFQTSRLPLSVDCPIYWLENPGSAGLGLIDLKQFQLSKDGSSLNLTKVIMSVEDRLKSREFHRNQFITRLACLLWHMMPGRLCWSTRDHYKSYINVR